MAINFDALPDKKGTSSISNFDGGLYNVIVEAADMKTSKKSGNPYLNVRLGVFSDEGTRITGVFDIFVDSEQPLMQYKLRRFLEACQIDLQGTFELKDLPKIIVNKKLQAYLKVQSDEQYGDKVVVDIAPDEIYVPLDEEAAIPGDADAPFEPDMTTEADTEY